MLISKIPMGFFVEVIDRGNKVVVGRVADLFEGIVQHYIQGAIVSDTMVPMDVLAGLLPPIVKPLSERFVIFIWNIVLYLRSA